MKFRKLIGTCVALFPLLALAELDAIHRNANVLDVHITGTITPSDAKLLQRLDMAMKERRKKFPENQWVVAIYYLDSIGGDMNAAMTIGKIIRQQGAPTHLFEGKDCLSACVLVLAGAPIRTISGRVGIHRPYKLSDGEATPEGQKSSYQKLKTRVTSYLQEMNIQPKLYDDMLYISPENMRVLSKKELLEYGLVDEDPYVEEASAARDAKIYGISRQEFARRKAIVNRLCSTAGTSESLTATLAYFECEREVYKGIRK